jgi:protein-tyrosine-phosphatase/predicted ATP-grasp superfamily ATP-dependent carboligase
MSTLVLDGHSPAALETLQSLGRAGLPVDITAERGDALAFGSRYARQRLPQPSTLEPDRFRDWLEALSQRHQYELIVASTERSLLALRRLGETEPLRLKAVLPPNSALDVALDKERTHQLATRLGIPVPKSVLIEDLSAILPCATYPLVLKPVRSKTFLRGRLINLEPRVVRNETDHRNYLERWLPLVPIQQQAYVAGTGVGIELLYDGGHKLWHFAHERIHEWPLTGGASSYRRSLWPSPELLEAAERLLGSLGWHGVAMVEFKLRSDGSFVLLEINPRLWGSLALALDAGVDFPRALLSVARGEQVPSQPRYPAFRYARNLALDARWMWANLQADHRDPLLLTRPRPRAFLEYLRPLLGRESWDHFDWKDLGVTLAILRQVSQQALAELAHPLWRRLLGLWARYAHRRVLARLRRASLRAETILFVCHGNICRSPFSAAIARIRLPRLAILSAGFHPDVGQPTPHHVIRAAASLNIDLATHTSSSLSAATLRRADLVLLMDTENYWALAKQFPEFLPRATLLGLFATKKTVDIPDPNDVDEASARKILASILPAVDGLAAWLEASSAGSPRA